MAALGANAQLEIGIVASLTPNTGNMHTCSRLQQVFVTAGHKCTLIDCNDHELSKVSLSFNALGDDRHPLVSVQTLECSIADVFVAMHAVRSGIPVLRTKRPFILLCGGEAAEAKATSATTVPLHRDGCQCTLPRNQY